MSQVLTDTISHLFRIRNYTKWPEPQLSPHEKTEFRLAANSATYYKQGRTFPKVNKLFRRTRHHSKCSKCQITPIKRDKRNFWFSSAYKSCVYIILLAIKCATAFCLKQCTYLFFLVGWDLTPIRSLCRSPRFV
jgi:hypothetical protein